MAQYVYTGSAGNDYLNASALGAMDSAVFRGGAGDDTCIGGAGNDRFDGGAGADSMFGGGGSDAFFIVRDNVAGGARDSIDGGTGIDLLNITISTYQLTDAVKAEIVRLRTYLAGDTTQQFVSDIFHVDMVNVETANIRLDGTIKALADVVAPSPVNHTAIIGGSHTGAVTEDGTLTATGRLTITDVDAGEAVFRAPASLAGSYGAFSFDAATGTWGYRLDNAAAKVQALKAGQVVGDSLTVISLDGTASKTIAVSITGSNDAATIGGSVTGTVQEDTVLLTGGTAVAMDADTGEAHFQDPVAAALQGSYGRFSFDAATGAWSYALDNASQRVQQLTEGQVVTDQLTLISLDGTASQAIVVTVIGTGDAVEISGTIAGLVTEDAVLTTGGQLTIHGEDAGASLFRPVDPGELVGHYGSFAFDPILGGWSYALDNAAPATQALRGGQTVTDTLTVWSAHWTASQLLTVTVVGGAEPLPLTATASGTGGLTILGEQAYDNAGLAIVGLGDLNGDGRPDLLVTAPGSAGYVGAAYVVWGRADGAAISLADIAAGVGGFRIAGEVAGTNTGAAAAAAGDVNGDGRPDLLLGAPYSGDPANPAGAAYVVFGKADGAAVSLAAVAAGSGGFRITGEAAYGLAGSSLAGPGDLNGDGRADLLIGAPEHGGGAAYVVFGKAGGGAVSLATVAAGSGGFRITGEATGDAAGSAVASIGDVNGDGRPDLLIGAPQSGRAGDQAGAAYVVFGKADGTAVSLAAVAAGRGGFWSPARRPMTGPVPPWPGSAT